MICNRLPYVLPVKQETLYPLLDETDAPGSSHRCLGLARWPAVHRCLELCLQSAEKKAKSYKVCSIKATATFTDVNSKSFTVFHNPDSVSIEFVTASFHITKLHITQPTYG